MKRDSNLSHLLLLLLLCVSASLSEDGGGEVSENDITAEQTHPDQAGEVDTPSRGDERTTTITNQLSCERTLHTVLRELGAMGERLETAVRALEDMKVKMEASKSQVSTLNTAVNELKRINQGKRLKNLLGTYIENELYIQWTFYFICYNMISNVPIFFYISIERPHVAFSATLGGGSDVKIGPFNKDYPLVFRRVLINIGNSYNPSSGKSPCNYTVSSC